MPQVQLKEMFPKPWGIVEHRRAEIESGSYGAFDRALGEEMQRQFLSAEQAAELMDACASTARRWLRKCDSRFILHDTRTLYARTDVEQIRAMRNASKHQKQEKAA